jgi:hypothetical protein
MILWVDPGVNEVILSALDHWLGEDEALVGRLAIGFDQALHVIEQDPFRGRPTPGLPPNYRRTRLAAHLPRYQFYFRIDPDGQSVLVYLLRHERQKPYSANTLRRKAQEAARRFRR